MRILLAIIIFFLLVVLHEWGHFMVARRLKVPILEFSIGFGPLLTSFERKGVEYSIRGVPLGGYVRMEDGIENDDPRGFVHRKPWEKIAIALAGPLMNFLIAVFIVVVVYSGIGMDTLVDIPVFSEVAADSPAEEAGLQAGDRCLSINGQAISTWTEFYTAVNDSQQGEAKALLLVIDRNGQEFTANLVPKYSEENGRYIIGVMATTQLERMNIFKAIPEGFKQIASVTGQMIVSLITLFTGATPLDDVAGPVGIASMVTTAAKDGMVTLLSLMALLSTNLGLMNLLPIPGLDGSKILFAFIEIIRRKPIDPEKEATITWIGFIFLISLFVLITYHDIGKLLGFG